MRPLRRTSPTAIAETVEHLDLGTVVKVSEAVSGEIVLEKLIDTLMRTAIEHAGAERGLLILPRGDEHRIEAEVTTHGNDGDRSICDKRASPLQICLSPCSATSSGLTRVCCCLMPPARAHFPAMTTFASTTHDRSSACRLLKQTRMVGVLYLENNLTPHVFTPARMAILKLLASEAAISLENTRLYGDLQSARPGCDGWWIPTSLGCSSGISTDRFVRPTTRSSACCIRP